MKEKKYHLTANNQRMASDMNLNTALLLIKALVEEYWAKNDTVVYVITEVVEG